MSDYLKPADRIRMAYLELLQLDFGVERIALQPVLSQFRDMLATLTDTSPEEVQIQAEEDAKGLPEYERARLQQHAVLEMLPRKPRQR